MPLYRVRQFSIQVATSQSNLGGIAGATNFFNGIGAGYSTNASGNDRRIKIPLDCTLASSSIILQQATLSTTATGGTVAFVNSTKGISTTLASSLSTSSDNAFYETLSTNLLAQVSNGDQFYLSVSGFSVQPTNLRIMAYLYFFA